MEVRLEGRERWKRKGADGVDICVIAQFLDVDLSVLKLLLLESVFKMESETYLEVEINQCWEQSTPADVKYNPWGYYVSGHKNLLL